MEVVEEYNDSVFGNGLVEGCGNFDEGRVFRERVCAGVGADDGDEAFGGNMVDYIFMKKSLY